MSFTEVLLLALALSADAFSVALAVGLRFSSARQVFRLSWHFGLFQALMPLLGALSGAALKRAIAGIDHWVAFGLLGAIGVHMIWEAWRTDGRIDSPRDPTRGLSLIGLSVATSLDAFGAGIGLGLSGAPLVPSCATIGVTCGLCTLAGMRLAARAGGRVGRFAGAFGGIVLVGLAVKMLGI